METDVSPLSPQEVALHSRIQAQWSTWPIEKIRVFAGRVVGSLSAPELRGVQPWIEKVKTVWDRVDTRARAEYWALEQALRALSQNDDLEQASSPPPPSPSTCAQAFSPRGSSAQSLAEEQKTEEHSVPAGITLKLPEAFTTSPDSASMPVAPVRPLEPEAEAESAAAATVTDPSPGSPGAVAEPADEASQLPAVFEFCTGPEARWELKRLGTGLAEERIAEVLALADGLLAEAQSLEQARQLYSVSAILRSSARELGIAQTVRDDAEAFGIRAEHHTHELIKEAQKRGELSLGSQNQLRRRNVDGSPIIIRESSGIGNSTDPEKPTLSQIGIDRSLAERLSRWSRFTRAELDDVIETKRREGRLTRSGVLSSNQVQKKPRKNKNSTSGQPLIFAENGAPESNSYATATPEKNSRGEMAEAGSEQQPQPQQLLHEHRSFEPPGDRALKAQEPWLPFLALLRDFAQNTGRYDAVAFADQPAVVDNYCAVRGVLRRFLQAFDALAITPRVD